MKIVMISPTPSQPDMPETGRVEVDLQKEILVVDIPDTDTTTDQPNPNVGDQSDSDDYEGFLDLALC